jgi:Tfp pilus assembly protein PilF
LDGNHYEVREQLVRIELSSNEIDNAIKDGLDALSLFPNQAWMNYLVGIAYVQKKELDKGFSYLKNTISIETDDKDLLSLTYSALGDLYHERKDDKNSDDSYQKALEYNPDNAFALNNFAYYLAIRGDDLDKATQMSQRANELQPNTPSFEDTFAWILFKQKKYTEARVWIERALAQSKATSAVQMEHYGDIMFYLGDTNAAVENWKKARSNGERSSLLDRKINERKYIE